MLSLVYYVLGPALSAAVHHPALTVAGLVTLAALAAFNEVE